MNVTVTLQFNGKYISRTGPRSEELNVNDQIEEAYRWIMEHLKQKYGIKPPFLLLVRGMHIMGAVKLTNI